MDIIRKRKNNKEMDARRDFLERRYRDGIGEGDYSDAGFAGEENFSDSFSNFSDVKFGHTKERDNSYNRDFFSDSDANENGTFDFAGDKKTSERGEFFPTNENRKKITDDEYVVVDNKKRTKPFKKLAVKILVALLFVGLIILGGFFFWNKAQKIEQRVLGVSDDAYKNIQLAITGAKESDFDFSFDRFSDAEENFSEISKSLKGLGKLTIYVSKYIPVASKLSSGYHLSLAGEQLSIAGKKASRLALRIKELKEGKSNKDNQISLLETFRFFEGGLDDLKINLEKARKNLDEVNIDDFPQDKRGKIVELKNKLAIVLQGMNILSDNNYILADLLGANGPRKYLFLFQNNQEMRATGGFIGSYGLLSIDSFGHLDKFFIDGIFNPDGQLTEKIVPPKPIQKISVAWSLHDSNWFPDFPLSAKKAMFFYEKTGGPTVDGVIAITPTVLQKLLKVVGPIKMDQYGLVLTADNFVENVQYEVEENYDKEENRPKKILSDMMPVVLNRIFESDDPKKVADILSVLTDSLNEKHILIFSTNDDLQKIISELGWSGEVLRTKGDYLSVINTNINGYKTDGVVQEKISHRIDIDSGGAITDTVTVKRKHLGGNMKYDWWNKVNADYMRVYVPQGATLLEVDGQTQEINKSPVDYDALGFQSDPDVKKEEDSIKLDEATSTRIYSEFEKNVFANWVYVSPQEEVIVKYKYILPFKINFSEDNPAQTYSLLMQKQSGSFGSEYDLQINYPSEYKIKWKSSNLQKCSDDNKQSFCYKGKLLTDKFFGLVFVKNL